MKPERHRLHTICSKLKKIGLRGVLADGAGWQGPVDSACLLTLHLNVAFLMHTTSMERAGPLIIMQPSRNLVQ